MQALRVINNRIAVEMQTGRSVVRLSEPDEAEAARKMDILTGYFGAQGWFIEDLRDIKNEDYETEKVTE